MTVSQASQAEQRDKVEQGHKVSREGLFQEASTRAPVIKEAAWQVFDLLQANDFTDNQPTLQYAPTASWNIYGTGGT